MEKESQSFLRKTGQEPTTVSEGVKIARAILRTKAYRVISEDRKEVFVLTSVALNLAFSFFEKLTAFSEKTGRKKEIDLPFIHKEERKLALLWFAASRKKLTNNEIYQLLGKDKIYGRIHERNVGRLPEGFKVTLKNKWWRIPYEKVPLSFLSPGSKWEANDYRRRREMALEIGAFVKKNKKLLQKGKGFILDIGGGTGELSLHLAKVLPPGIIIVIQEYSPAMIAEGERKIKKLNLEKRIIFVQASAEIPFENESKESPKQQTLQKLFQLGIKEYEKAPVIGAVSSYVWGALPEKLVKPATLKTIKDVCPGGLIWIKDFANPEENYPEFLKQTKKTGEYYHRWKKWLTPPLKLCYHNWEHRVEHIQKANNVLKKMGIKAENRWYVSTFCLLPLFKWPPGKPTSVISIPIPGFVERDIIFLKP